MAHPVQDGLVSLLRNHRWLLGDSFQVHWADIGGSAAESGVESLRVRADAGETLLWGGDGRLGDSVNRFDHVLANHFGNYKNKIWKIK